MRQLISIVVAIVFVTDTLIGQDWVPVGEFNGVTHRIIKDQSESNLFFSGSLQTHNDTTQLYTVARFDGETMSSVNGASFEVPDEYSFIPQHVTICSFGNRLYYEATEMNSNYTVIPWMEGDSVSSNYLVFENGSWSNWDMEWAVEDNTPNDRTDCMQVIDNEMWVLAKKIDDYVPFRWARVQPDGTTLHYELSEEENEVVGELQGTFTNIFKWNDNYYLSGRFYQTNGDGTGSTQVHIIKWDGQDNFEYLPQAFFGGPLTAVFDMEIYQGKLVVAGSFNVGTSQSPSNYIMTWDGNEWAPLFGNGTNGAVNQLKVFGDKLFFAGSFTQLFRDDGVYSASRIAYFDGVQAYRLSESVINWSIADFEFFQGKLYIVGNIVSIQLQNFGHIARFEGELPVSTGQTESELLTMKVFPNPCAQACRVQFSSHHSGGILHLLDSKGVVVLEQQVLPGESTVSLPIISSAEGMYFLRFQDNNGQQATTKIIK